MLKTMGMGTDGMSRRTLAVVIAILMLFATLVAVPGGPLNPTEANAAHVGAPAGNSVSQHYAWNPQTGDWSTGQPKMYTEGETAPFRVTLNNQALAGETYYFSVCLDVNLSPPHAFTGFDSYDTTYGGVVNNPAPGDLESTNGNFSGVNLDIIEVEPGGFGEFGCSGSRLATRITYTMHDPLPATAVVGTIVYGGVIAAPGATLPGTLGTVPDGGGAGSINGVFQATLGDAGSGQKTVNFKGSDIILAAPGVDIEKHTNGQDADTPTGPYVTLGDAVTWEFIVTNTGETDLENVSVTDDVLGAVSCPSTTLAMGASMTCTVNGTATFAGQYENTGTVTAEPPGRPEDQVTDSDPSHYFGVAGGLTVEKATNGQDADSAPGPYIQQGDAVTWTYVVTNTSNASVTSIQLGDDKEGVISCPKTELAPQESMECTANGTAGGGQYANLAIVSGLNGAGDLVEDDDPSHYFGVTGGLTIEKSTNGEDADSAPGPYITLGDPVAWEYEVTNTSNATVTNISVTDDQDETVTCPSDTLAAGASMTCTANGTATAGQYENIGSVTGTLASGGLTSDDDPSHYFGTDSSIDIEKWTNGEDADSPTGPFITVGDTVTWTYAVGNTGNADLVNVVVTDDQGVIPVLDPASDIGGDGILSPGEAWVYEASGVAVAGQYSNLGIAQATDPTGNTVGDTDPSHYFGVASSIDIEKSTNDQDADSPTGPNIAVGGTVNWEYRVTNTGNADLTNVVVTDDQGVTPVLDASSDVGSDGILSPGEVWVYAASGAAVAGQYANLGSVTADDPTESEVSDSDMSHYFGVAEGSLAIEKLVDNLEGGFVSGAVYPNGLETIVWQISVSNDGVGLLENVTLTDAFEASCETAFETAMTTAGFEDGGSFFLPEGEGVTFECQSTVGGFIGAINTASAQGEDILGRQVGPVESTATVTRVAPSATIGDTVFADENGNGIQDNGEKGIAGADVKLTLPDNSTLITSTNANGLYLFSGLLPGDYKVELVLSSIPKPENGDLKITTASSFNVSLADGEAFLDADFGVQATLPKTGFNSEDVARFGLALLLLGLVAVLVTRRREEGEEG